MHVDLHVLHIVEVDFADGMQPRQAEIVDDAVEGIALRKIGERLARCLAVLEVARSHPISTSAPPYS